MEKEHCREVRCAHEKAREKLVTAEIRRKAPRNIGGRKAAFGRKRGRLRREVMRRKIAGGSDAGKYILGSDARRNVRGRKARFAGMKNRSKIRRIALRSISGRKAGFARRRGRLRREVRLGSTSQEVMLID